MRLSIAAVFAVTLTLSLPLLFAGANDPASEARKHIDQAKAAVDEGRYVRAADHLQQTLGSLQALTRKELEKFHPVMGEGWEVEGRPKTEGDLFYVVQAVRSYRRKTGESKVGLSIISSRRFAALHREYYNLVELQEFQDLETDSETIDADGWEGYRREPKDDSVTTVAYHSNLVVIAVGEDPDLVSAVWKKIDFKRLQRFAEK